MSEEKEGNNDEKPAKKNKKGILIGGIGAILLGAGGFYATYSGIILAEKSDSGHEVSNTYDDGGHDSNGPPQTHDVVFVALDPLTISLGKFSSSRHLRFKSQLEVEPDAVGDVEHLRPRIIDVLNTYLRAVSESELEDPASMNRLRSQMLRRVQVVVGEGKVRDLLIMEFVLN